MPNKPASEQLEADNRDLRARLNEAEETLRAIRGGEVDALVLSGAEGDHILTLKGGLEPYRIMVEAMNEGAVALARDGAILYSNRRFAKQVKVPLGKIVGRPLQGMLAEQDRERFDALLVRGAAGDIRETLTLQAADGTQIPTLFSMCPLPQSEGKAISIVIADLSEVVAAAQARSRLALIIESSDDAIVSTTLDGVVESWNRAAEDLYGYTAGEALGQSIDSLIVPPERVNELIDELEAVRRGGSTLLEDSVRLRKDGFQVDVSIKASPILDDAGKVVGASINARNISERKIAEHALEKSEKRLSEALTIARIGYWEYEYSTDEFIFNDQYYQLHKITAGEAGGYRMSSADFVSRYVYPEDAPVVAQQVRLAFETRDPNYVARTEARILSGEGEIIWVDVRFGILKDLQGKTINLIGVNQDITVRKRAELDLLWRSAFFEALVKTSADGILVVDTQNKKILQNQRLIDLLEIPVDIAANPDDSPQLHFVINQVVDAKQFGDKVRYLYDHPEEASLDEIALKNGTLLERYSAPVPNDNGHSYGRIWTFHDITKRKQAELALRTSEERFKTIYLQAPLGIALIDSLTGKFYDANPRFAEIAGRSEEEMLNIDWLQITHPDDLQADLENMALMNAGKLPGFRMEKRYLHPDGTAIWIDMTISPIKVGEIDHPRHLCLIQDISEQRKAKARIVYLNRVYAVLSGINSLIVRVKDREELFREACNIAVEEGGFLMSMLVIVDGSTKQITSFASAGMDDGLLSAIKSILSTSEGVQSTMIARAISEKESVVSNDVTNDPRALLGNKYAEFGVRSLVVLPLLVAGEAVGVLTLYSSEIDFFLEEELKLLAELAGDIAFAIDHIDKTGAAQLSCLLRCAHRTCQSQPVFRAGDAVHAQRGQWRVQARDRPDRS